MGFVIFPNISEVDNYLFFSGIFRKIYLLKETFHTVAANISQFQNRTVVERDTNFSEKHPNRFVGRGAFHKVVKKLFSL